ESLPAFPALSSLYLFIFLITSKKRMMNRRYVIEVQAEVCSHDDVYIIRAWEKCWESIHHPNPSSSFRCHSVPFPRRSRRICNCRCQTAYSVGMYDNISGLK